MKDLTDEALMTLVAEGDLEKMRHLYERYKGKIYSFSLIMMKDKDLSLDITQEVFYKILKHRRTYRNTKFSSWIYAIARNLCNDHYQLKAKSVELNADQDALEQIVEETKERVGSDELLDQAMNRLSQEDKELVLISRFQKLRYQEIAEINGTTVGAIKTRVHRAIMKLRTEYFKISEP